MLNCAFYVDTLVFTMYFYRFIFHLLLRRSIFIRRVLCLCFALFLSFSDFSRLCSSVVCLFLPHLHDSVWHSSSVWLACNMLLLLVSPQHFFRDHFYCFLADVLAVVCRSISFEFFIFSSTLPCDPSTVLSSHFHNPRSFNPIYDNI